MLNTSARYKEVVIQNGTMWKYKLVINDVEYRDFLNFNCKYGIIASDSVNFGEAVSSYIDVKLTKYINPIQLAGQKAHAYAGLYLIEGNEESIEWIKLGAFNIVKPTLDSNTVSFTAYDNMMHTEQGLFTNLTGIQKIAAILSEQCIKMGVSYVGGDDGSSIDVDKLKGLTIREAFQICASYCGKNIIVNRDGNFELKWFNNVNLTIPAKIISAPLEIGEQDYLVSKLSCAIGDDAKTILHSGNDLGISISFSNQCMSQERLDQLMQNINGFRYRNSNVHVILGRPDIEVGDIITIQDQFDNYYTIPIFILDLPLDGGMPISISSSAKTITEEEFDFKGTISTKVERAYSESISAKEILAETVTAWNGKFNTIDTDILKVNNELQANKGKFGELDADIARLKQADIDNLNAVNAVINTAKIDIAEITTIINRFTTSDSIHSLLINTETAVIGDATIKSAMIDTLDFNKLTGIDINTTNFKVHSKDGMSQWYDNTIQIKDGNRIRVQIGKDASSDYNMYIWDAQGSLMFDAKGIKSAGIKDKIIRDDMVSDTANIAGKKINISSLVTEINNGTTSITASHVIYDGKSLDVAFKTVTDGLNTLNTSFSIEQGKIKTLITDMSQSKQDITSMKSSFSNMEQTLTSFNVTISEHTTKLDTVSGKVTSLETNLNGFKLSVANTYATTESMNSAIKIKADEINLSVSKTYATIIDVNNLPSDIKKMMLGVGETLPANADLNTYKTVGVWTTSNMSGVTNVPTGIQSSCELRLVVEYMGSTSYIQQTLISTYAGSFRGAWRRTGSSSSWKSWNLMTDTSNVVSSINQSAESIKISASKIDLTGYVTISNLSTPGSTTIDGSNIRTGTITASHIQSRTLESITINSGTFNTVGGVNKTELKGGVLNLINNGVQVGNIGTNQLLADSSKKGLVFDLEYDGSYMAWANKDTSYASTYSLKLVYASEVMSGYGYANTLFLGCDLDTLNRNVWLDSGHAVKLTAFTDGAGVTTNEGGTRFTFASSGVSIARFGRVYGAGNINFYANLDLNGFSILGQSDARLKENIVATEVKGLDTINSLNLVEWDWLTTGKHENIGIIAQQLLEICPDLVHQNEDGIYSINQIGLIPYLLKAIQELYQMVNKTRSVQMPNAYNDPYTDAEKQELVQKFLNSMKVEEVEKKDVVLNRDNEGIADISLVDEGRRS